MSFTSSTRTRSGPILPLAAMVDILFLLLIFFMVSYSMREHEAAIDVTLPSSEQAQAAASPTQIIISIRDDGAIFLGQQPHTLESLQETLTELARQFPHETVLIRGDRESRLGLAIRIMDIANAANLRNVYLATTRPASEL